MKVAAIISEYNPFHNGHKLQIKKTREKYDVDYIIAIMSGQFTQRGIPSILNKYQKTYTALNNGVDLVIELPTAFSTSSAEYFAAAGVHIANNLGIVDYLSFGTEHDNIEDLSKIASLLSTEDASFSEQLKKFLQEGNSFPKARELAISSIYTDISDSILSQPNNILAIEYIKALLRSDSSVKPVNIIRNTSAHNSISSDSPICSSYAIREKLFSSGINDSIINNIPSETYNLLRQTYTDNCHPLECNDFSSFLQYKLLECNNDDFIKYYDVSEALSNKIKNSIPDYTIYDEYTKILKSKELTHSRISRALLHILLNIDYQPDCKDLYINILGFNSNAKELLNKIKRNSTLPIISKNSNYQKLLNSNSSRKLFETDIFAYQLYNAAFYSKNRIKLNNIFKESPIIL